MGTRNFWHLIFSSSDRRLMPESSLSSLTAEGRERTKGHGNASGATGGSSSGSGAKGCWQRIVNTGNKLDRTLLIAGVVGLACEVILSIYYIGHMPGEMHPESGRTYAFLQHGWVVYLTLREFIFVRALFWGSSLAILAGAVLQAYRRKRV